MGFGGDGGSFGVQGDSGGEGDTGGSGPRGFQGVTGPLGFAGPNGPQVNFIEFTRYLYRGVRVIHVHLANFLANRQTCY